MLLLRKRFYRFVRRVFPSLEHADHEKVKRRLSFIYAFSAWQGFALMLYIIYKRRAPKDEEGAIDYPKFLTTAHKDAHSGTIIYFGRGKPSKEHLTEQDLAKIREEHEAAIKAKEHESASA